MKVDAFLNHKILLIAPGPTVILKHQILLRKYPMTKKRLFALAAGCALALLAACGGGDGVKLGEFPALSATEGDAPITLKAPTSASPASFSFDSSNLAVAMVAGDKLTIVGAGTSTITARQGQMGSYNPTSTTTLLTVAQRVCAAPAERVQGVCVPAATTAAYVTNGTLNWMPASSVATWAAADAFCKGVTGQGVTGWRLPTQFELTALVGSGKLAEKGWNLSDTWTSSAGAAEKQHVAVNLTTNVTMSVADATNAYVTCTR